MSLRRIDGTRALQWSLILIAVVLMVLLIRCEKLISQSLLNILINCHFIIEPLLAYFKQTLLSDSIIACDDTGLTLLYRGCGW